MEYEYQPLKSADQIRVIVLHAAQDVDAPLRCSMDHISPKDRTKRYECISYTWQASEYEPIDTAPYQLTLWFGADGLHLQPTSIIKPHSDSYRGGQTRDHDLICDDNVVHITANLASGLRRFRSKHRARTLWADAICINQHDEIEKSAQIPMMAAIFSNAERVRVWLGTEGEESMKAVEDIAWRDASTEPFSSKDAESCRQFFGLPWFSRRWVIQEVVLNTDVVFYCGSMKMSWTSLNNVYQRIPDELWAENKQEGVRKTLAELGHLWLRACYSRRYGREVNLWDLLQDLSHMQCENTKDRIYALAGLADDVRLVGNLSPEGDQKSPMYTLTSDYGCSDAQLFGNITTPRLNASALLYSTLAYAGAHRPLHGKRRFASWIPDFSLPQLWAVDASFDRTYLGPSTFAEDLDGSLNLTIQALSWNDAEGVRSSAWQPNRVEFLFPDVMSLEPQAAMENLHAIEAWFYSELDGTHQHPKGLLRILITGIMPQIYWRGTHQLHANELEGRALAAANVHILRDRTLREGEELPVSLMSQFFAALAGRRFFVSERIGYRVWNNTIPPSTKSFTTRHIGFGPVDMQTGDQFIASSACGKALFFREVEGGHELLGGGYSRLPVTGSEAPPRREVTFRII